MHLVTHPSLSPSSCLALASVQSELFTPRLLLLINEADNLLSTDQFGEAAKVHLEAIAQSYADYLLYYKGGTVYSCMQRHTSVLEDFKRVLSLTSSTFNNGHLMEARIQTLESTHTSLALYVRKKTKYREAEALGGYLTELERVRGETEEEPDAGLWNARLSHFLPSSTHLLTHIFHYTCFYLPPPPTLMATLKQSLHFDPDSKPGLSLRHLGKILDKPFFALDELLSKENLRAKADLWKRSGETMASNVAGEGKERLSRLSLRCYSNPHYHPRRLQHHHICVSSLSHPSSLSSSPPYYRPLPYTASSKHPPLLFAYSSSSLRSDSPTPPTSLIGDEDADKATITNNAGDVAPVRPSSFPVESVVAPIEPTITPPMGCEVLVDQNTRLPLYLSLSLRPLNAPPSLVDGVAIYLAPTQQRLLFIPPQHPLLRHLT
ncbi:hypothetical protein BJ165DRAFT_1530755 [Panaeolus papilionaceus]|nr:hypothetical protein BJ165DRAFT_1530755 [Panaeolus papilionaceus]